MKKKIALLTILLMLGGTSLFAGGIDFQVGAGYNGYFISSSDSDFNGYPLGFTLYGGAGFKILPMLSIGAEYEFGKSWDTSDFISGQTLTITEHLPKAYIKLNALNILTVSALAGVDIWQQKVDGNKADNDTAFTAGLRVSALFAYAQYMMVFNDGRTDSRLIIGAVFSK